ncbi:hypothetical protein NDU88_005903 [Pleurodeles waltl]|uniref:Uncharacterized protein n=1 Tax=Pleurodeles waltl TaxID=8319 RepID=A0AAV7TCE5_PLEWA|nr:hypothetical protein NDU88_005903 [Pleurodeles waltl]
MRRHPRHGRHRLPHSSRSPADGASVMHAAVQQRKATVTQPSAAGGTNQQVRARRAPGTLSPSRRQFVE